MIFLTLLITFEDKYTFDNFLTPVYNFLNKKISYRGFLMYNEFTTNHYKGR